MFKLLVLLFGIKLYARNDILNKYICTAKICPIEIKPDDDIISGRVLY